MESGFEEELWEVFNKRAPKDHPLRKYVDNYMKHGYLTWYDWRLDKWGTKWNAYNHVYHGLGEMEFETAWSTPEPVMRALSVKFPNVEITVRFADEDIGTNCGEYSYKNGALVHTHSHTR